LINVNFSTDVYNGAAASTDFGSSQFWNKTFSRSGESITNLKNSDGDGSTVSFVYDPDGVGTMSHSESAFYTGTNPADDNLMGSYMYYTGAHPLDHMTFGGLVAGENYELYIYTQSENNVEIPEQLIFRVNDGSYVTSTANNGKTGTFTPGLNYVLGTYSANSSGQLVIDYAATGTSNRVVINGLQLRGPATPEPASLVLLGIGGLLGARRLKKKSGKTSVPAV
jgi:hypothetical protein